MSMLLPNKSIAEKINSLCEVPAGHQFKAAVVWEQLENALPCGNRRISVYKYAMAAAMLLCFVCCIAYLAIQVQLAKKITLAKPVMVQLLALTKLTKPIITESIVKKDGREPVKIALYVPVVKEKDMQSRLHADKTSTYTSSQQSITLHQKLEDTSATDDKLTLTGTKNTTEDTAINASKVLLVKKKLRVIHLNEFDNIQKDGFVILKEKTENKIHFNAAGNNKISKPSERPYNYSIPLFGSKTSLN